MQQRSMARQLTQKQLIPQDENLNFLRKGSVKGKSTGFKLEKKKIGTGFGNRKALGDITNKSSVHHEASLKRKSTPKEEPNMSEEMFLHDHKKCIESQKAAMRASFWDTLLPGCVPHETRKIKSTKSEIDTDSECSHPEPVEIPMSDYSDLFQSSTFPSSPSQIWLDSPPWSPSEWDFGPVEFKLKEDSSDP
ncbi:protein PATRONUS 2 [Coffea arabica]|uniref:Protein PATRONUS 2 n=1 Tax=Coffea arabica TaxID=13443 RepID=A0A6P6VL64_COFAR|nr:protein PATRONUS 2-like [Coffea arabica]XP_027102709.1 protein PATRONUS 2-like [Coffea arabica]